MANYSHHWIGTVLNRGYNRIFTHSQGSTRTFPTGLTAEEIMFEKSRLNCSAFNDLSRILPIPWIFNHYFPIEKTCLERSRRCLRTATISGTTRSSKYVSLRLQILKTNPFKWFSVHIDSIHLLKILSGLAVHYYRFNNFYHNKVFLNDGFFINYSGS